MEDHKAQLGVTDLQMGLTTLEEVFLTITKQADLENAAAEGRVETLTVDGQAMNVRPMFGVFGMLFSRVWVHNASSFPSVLITVLKGPPLA